MESFRTDVRISRTESLISHKTPILTVGSCFADAIGQRMSLNKFSALVNPFGTSYNPVSIHKTLEGATRGQRPGDSGILLNNELFSHFDFHSSFAAPEKTLLTNSLNTAVDSVHSFIKKTDFIMITYGTSWVYIHKELNQIVSNCHKVPAREFEKKLLSPDETYESFRRLHTTVKAIRPGVRFILTLSPVRHLKDTLELNSVSKAALRVACHNISRDFAEVDYFPAFEMMVDDLRDYRFYKADMIHPTELAEDYIWEKFQQRYMDASTIALIKEWQSITAAIKHKPFHPGSNAHQQFIQTTIDKIEKLKGKFDVSEELAALNRQLERVV